MATDNTTEPATWLELKCTKFTPKETLDWVLSAWSKTVKPEFAKFRKAIADQSTPIPNTFFEVASLSHGNRNSLFTFVRPKKILYISRALPIIRTEKQRTQVQKVLTSYLEEWMKCLNAIEQRYPDNLSANECRHLLERIAETTCLSPWSNSGPSEEDQYKSYKELYGRFCNAFNAIPCQMASSQKTIDAVKEALKLSAVAKKPRLRKKRKLNDRQIANKAKIAKVVKVLRQLNNPGPGKPKRSVLKALRVLKYREVYGPIIKELNLSDNTWKKYVQSAKKKELQV